MSENTNAMTLPQMKEWFKHQNGMILTRDEYERMSNYIDKLSDYDFLQLLGQIRYEADKAGNQNASLKERLNTQKEYIEHFKINTKDLAYNDFTADFLSEKNNTYCIEQIKSSSPSDSIYLTSKEDEFLINLWETHKVNVTIPSDLFFAKTIPLLDCVITVDERENENGTICKYRVVIFEEYKDKIDYIVKNDVDSPCVVGAVIMLNTAENDNILFIPITVVRGTDSLVGGYIGYFDKKITNLIQLKRGDLSQGFVSMMETWYGIQIALLHPAVKDVFRNPQRCNSNQNVGKQKHKKRKVKYIRKHYLTIDELETVSGSKEARKINRKCLCWYVIGHWRTYKNGKKVFIMPYWKGVLRNLKQNANGDEREREINFEWTDIAESINQNDGS